MNITRLLLLRRLSFVLLALTLLALFSAACARSGNTTPLTGFTENSVAVSVWLEQSNDGSYLLRATFTPPAGFHLYSKDVPISGIGGLGRPTLLELPPEARMQASGPLSASAAAGIPAFEAKDLPVYPAGPVTLSLPVSLPTAENFEDVISVTYMACSKTGCKPPVVGKLVEVKIALGTQ